MCYLHEFFVFLVLLAFLVFVLCSQVVLIVRFVLNRCISSISCICYMFQFVLRVLCFDSLSFLYMLYLFYVSDRSTCSIIALLVVFLHFMYLFHCSSCPSCSIRPNSLYSLYFLYLLHVSIYSTCSMC